MCGAGGISVLGGLPGLRGLEFLFVPVLPMVRAEARGGPPPGLHHRGGGVRGSNAP